MKTKFFPILFLLGSITMLSSCKSDELTLSGSNELIFGHFYGECMGENCKVFYKLTENGLLSDTKHNYPSSNSFYTGDFTLLSTAKYNATKDLINYFPMELLNESSNVIGQPDVADGGGLYIEYNFNGVHKFWLIDQMKNNVPEKYHVFMDKVNEKIQYLLSPNL